MRRRSTAVVVALTWALVVTGCSTDPGSQPDPAEPAEPADSERPQTSPPADDVTVLTSEEPDQLARDLSQALYDQTPVVVLVATDDPAGQREAAGRAVELGVPLLLTPAGGAEPEDDIAGLGQELDRLAATAVLTYGEVATRWARQLDTAIDIIPAGDDPVPAGRATPGTEASQGGTIGPEPPPVVPAEPLTTVTVLVPPGDHTTGATATARAAGARVLLTETTDPRTDPELITTLADQPPSHTMALGAQFGPVDRLRARLAVATTGVELPGGGQVLFPGRRLIALYGHPGDSVLGALGEQSMAATLDRARGVAAEYEPLVGEPVVPTLEIITTIASASAGAAGDYSRRTPVEQLREWVDAAAGIGAYVVLDLQPGHTDFLTQAMEYEELLVEPHVGLALDPEWRLAPDQRHMRDVGSVTAAEANQVIEWLADLTASHQLPQKLLILHQFQLRMISDRGAVDTGRDEVAVLIHADGFGTPAQKLDTWRALHGDPLPGAWWGWKNFYDEDQPMLTPERTVAVSPSPVFISYQ